MPAGSCRPPRPKRLSQRHFLQLLLLLLLLLLLVLPACRTARTPLALTRCGRGGGRVRRAGLAACHGDPQQHGGGVQLPPGLRVAAPLLRPSSCVHQPYTLLLSSRFPDLLHAVALARPHALAGPDGRSFTCQPPVIK